MPCGKRCYSSKRAARQAVKNMHESIRLYRCGECGGAFHTTQERYGKVTRNSRTWNAKASKRKRNR